MTVLNNIGLVLEGGGMRGMFSAGVFEAFMQENIEFPYIAAVSAGACNVCSYVSHQPLRTRKIIEKYIHLPRYCGIGNLLKSGSLFDFDYIMKEIPQKLLPFDYATFDQANCCLQVGTTDCESGQAVWFDKKDMGRDFEPLRASSSLPFIAPMVNFRGRKLLDGGLLNPIPIEKALNDGYQYNVIILTRNYGYRNTEHFPLWALRLWYHKYPALIAALCNRKESYNRQIALVEQLEKEGKAFVIRPQNTLTVKRLDRDPTALLALHDQGREYALTLCQKLRVWAEKV